jgi:ankyrin repeat protein
MTLDALLDAADHGRLDELTAILDAGQDVNAADAGGWTALLGAARAVQKDAVVLLLERGADVNAVRPGGYGALHLVEQAASEDGLSSVHLAVVAILLDAGIDPNQQTSKLKQSPVRNAAALGQAPLLQLLVDCGRADLNITDKAKATPLYAAADAAELLSTRVLLDGGAHVSIADRFGRTPLHAAAIVGSLPVALALLEAGAEPTAQTRYPFDRFRGKTTALEIAEKLGHTDVAALLTGALAEPIPAGTAPWPDKDSADAVWIRDLLTGKTHIPSSRSSHHVFDDVLALKYDPAKKERLTRGFRGLLIDDDPRVRAAAVHWYTSAPDDGVILRAWTEHRALFAGVKSPWFPDDRDLRALLASVLSRYSLTSTDARAAMRSEALIRGRGMSVVAGLVASDRRWLLDNVIAIVSASPDALPVLLGTARMRNLDPEAILRRLIGQIDDAHLIAAIRSELPEWGDWLDGVVAKAIADTSLDVEEAEDDYLSESRAMLGKLLDYDSGEVISKIDAMLDAAPELGEALVIEMASRHMDLRGVVVALRDRVERETLKTWLQAAVDDELQLLVYMAMI